MICSSLWVEISCTVPSVMVDCLAEYLVDVTGGGVSVENLSVDTFSVDTVEDSPVKTIKAYFAADQDVAGKVQEVSLFLQKVGISYPGFVYHAPGISYIREEDWANSWKVHFKPSRIGTRLVIKPSWEEHTAQDDDLVIELDPGMAFGTGTHATTRLCLEALERMFLHQPPYHQVISMPSAVLDVGTGSGVLAIAAAKLGAERVVGIDIDPGAVAVAEENVQRNEVVTRVRVSTEALDALEQEYDIVLANILAEDLARLAGELVSKLRPAGMLILSGILTEKEGVVLTGFAPHGVSLIETTRAEEWSCLVYGRGR